MKTKAFFFFALLVLTGCTGVSRSATAETRKISPDVWDKVQKKGTARVIVELDVPTQPGQKRTPAEELAQRSAIAKAQKEVLADLVGTKHKVYMQSDRTRALAMEVGVDAINVLEHSQRVTRIYEDFSLPSPNEIRELKPIPK